MAKQGHNRGCLGLEISGDGIAIAHVQGNHGARPTLKGCEFISAAAITSKTVTLRDRISALGLNKVPCNWVLVNPDYNLLLVEAPKVPEQEMREAVRWRIKDLITFSVEDAVVDVFPLPSDGTRGAAMSYVVVTQKSQIQEIVDTAGKAKITLNSIDIGELALRNLADYQGADGRGACLIRLRQGRGSLALIKQAQVYLSRQFDLPYNAGLLDDLPEDNLVLELQRSIDYYERQLGQVPPGQLLFCGENISDDKLTDSLRRALPGNSACLQLSALLNGANRWEESLLQLCVGAIGGALRQGVAA
jgi:MSHA biogenesis protein MshI